MSPSAVFATSAPGSPPPIDSRVLITGGAGFIGRNLALHLHRNGQPVTVLDTVHDPNAEFGRRQLDHAGIPVVQGDLGDRLLVSRLLEDHQVVVHLAAPTVDVAQMLGTPHAQIQALRDSADLAAQLGEHHVLLFGSTSDVYGLHSLHYRGKPMAEDDLTVYEAPTQSRWNYSRGKSLAENVFACSAARTVSVRIFNTYGAGFDYPQPRRVIPRFLDAAASGRALRVSGQGTQHRAFCHIDDLVNGMAKALTHAASLPPSGNLAVNLGNPDAYSSILDLAHLVADVAAAAGLDRPPVELDGYPYPERFNDAWDRIPDITRARTLLGYQPNVPLREGLERALAFYLEHGAVLSGGPS